jgi:hypothetical protein
LGEEKMNGMIEGLILIEGEDLNADLLSSLSLGNAKQLLVGWVPPRRGIILHVTVESPSYFGSALLDLAQVSGVTKVLTLALQIPQ